jgi:hypothetical protein
VQYVKRVKVSECVNEMTRGSRPRPDRPRSRPHAICQIPPRQPNLAPSPLGNAPAAARMVSYAGPRPCTDRGKGTERALPAGRRLRGFFGSFSSRSLAPTQHRSTPQASVRASRLSAAYPGRGQRVYAISSSTACLPRSENPSRHAVCVCVVFDAADRQAIAFERGHPDGGATGVPVSRVFI